MYFIQKFIKDDKHYFFACENIINTQNNRMLVDGCLVYAAVLIFYTIFSCFTNQPLMLRKMYYIFDIVHLMVCIAVFLRPKKIKEKLHITQLYCAFLEISVLGFFVLEGALVSTTQHSLYVPIAILLIQLLYIHTALYTCIVNILYVLIFASLSYMHKVPVAYTNDIYIAFATFISANIGYLLIARIRHNEGKAMVKYEHLSRTDMLTGLNNKITTEELCTEILEKSDDNYAFLVLDLDNFKNVNDNYGHNAGDDVIKEVASVIKKSFRSNDIIGRFGGDEFIVMMEKCGSVEDVEFCLKFLKQGISELRFSYSGLTIHCSVGIAFRRENDNFNSLFTRADKALYDAKNMGKGCYFFRY